MCGRAVVKVLFLIPNHLLDDPGHAGLLNGALADKAAIAEDGDVIANLHQLFQPVRDVDNGDATALKLGDNVKQHPHFRLAQRAGGLVHNQHPGVFGERTGDLHQLLMTNSQFA